MPKLYPTPGSIHYAIQFQSPPAGTSFVTHKFLDIRYAFQSASQMLDIYLPGSGEGPYPVIMYIHGGAFMGCDKADQEVLPALQGLKRGYAVVAVNYRLSGEAKFPGLFHDVWAAVRWPRAHAGRYHLDPERIAAWGGSAGGYLASMLGVSAGVPELEDLHQGNPDQLCHVQAAVVWYGPTNFMKMDEQLASSGLLAPEGMRHNDPHSPEALLLGRRITRLPIRVAAANPETYIRENASQFFIQHGTRDAVVPVQQSIGLAEKLAEAIGAEIVRLELLEGAEHADPRFKTPENVQKVLDFLDGILKNKTQKKNE
jgi:acetyl esterase/lipase